MHTSILRSGPVRCDPNSLPDRYLQSATIHTETHRHLEAVIFQPQAVRLVTCFTQPDSQERSESLEKYIIHDQIVPVKM